MTVNNGLTVNGALTLYHNVGTSNSAYFVGLNFTGGDQTLGGTGTVTLRNRYTDSVNEQYVRVHATDNSTLTIGANLTVNNASDSYFTTLGSGTTKLDIQGTVSAQSSRYGGQTLRVTGASVSNNGQLQANAGELDVNNLTGGVGLTSIGAGDLDLDGAYTLDQDV